MAFCVLMESSMKPIDKASRKEKEYAEADDDPRPEWEREDQEMEGRKPNLEEIEEDPASL
jgi:hypothetical protein